jgi:hypothetical protein
MNADTIAQLERETRNAERGTSSAVAPSRESGERGMRNAGREILKLEKAIQTTDSADGTDWLRAQLGLPRGGN